MNTDTQYTNKELFEIAPPYMISRPGLQGGLYMSDREKDTSRIWQIYMQLFTNPHKGCEKSAWNRCQIYMKMMKNTPEDYDKYTWPVVTIKKWLPFSWPS